jgi:hypothetical protein
MKFCHEMGKLRTGISPTERIAARRIVVGGNFYPPGQAKNRFAALPKMVNAAI